MDKQMTQTTTETSRRDRMRRIRAEGGQTPTEYLMIVGIMAAVVLIAFVVFFWPQVQKAAKNWAGNSAAAIDSTNNVSGNTVDENGKAKK